MIPSVERLPGRSAAESELSLIGIALAYGEDAAEAFERLRPDHFGEPILGVVWETMADLRRSGGVDLALVDQRLAGNEAYAAFGGGRFLADLLDRAYLGSLDGHVEAVADAAMRRAIDQLTQAAREREGSSSDVLAYLEAGAADIARRSGSGSVGSPVGLNALETLEAAWDGQFRGLSTGLECLDRITGGIQPDHVWIVGGRTSMGKSVVLPGLARGFAQQGRGVLFFSLEMPLREVQARVTADLAYDRDLVPFNNDGGNVEFADLLRGRGTREQRDRARSAASQMASLPITVNDRGGWTLDDIINMARRQVRAWERAGIKPGAIMIDHIGLVRPTKARDSKAAEAADTVDRLKDAAKQIGAPIVAAAQVNRGPENRQDKRPTMGDLNWSGSIEQIADLVILLYRDAYYLSKSGNPEDEHLAVSKRNELEMIVPKNRSGPTCTLHAHVEIACSAVRDQLEAYEPSYRGRA
ncbi:DnaB-like helicase C-terminal domain-containing protein [Brevundimonas sp. 2R-24]|uniref:DNA 5'-3' helicase n=1 Tax=Peiella sedimenti TaxID=3061083 RepID=A0ABT8SQN3_9CAUL|nr:DnaB-like helicase C-terminal domain-containing protein [Caulobacteraceae bacterium XZ-24]